MISRSKLKTFLALSALIALSTCIDPYKPVLKGYDSLLVVEGLITNENRSYEVKLSKTLKSADKITEKVDDALISISDETGFSALLTHSGNGTYKTDSTVFTGTIGKTYTLDILTSDGQHYVSEPSMMLPVPEIDSIYYGKDSGYSGDHSKSFEGISIYLDSKAGDGNTDYLRWAYEETWKFRLPLVKKFNFFNDTTIIPISGKDLKEFCWKQQKSTSILLGTYSPSQSGNIIKIPISFIGSYQSDRLSIQYSILVKQYSISEKESRFWTNLKDVEESGGDIFGSQPYPVISNIKNTANENERVLGYFEVSGVTQKRKDITFNELLKLNLPLYHYNCTRYTTSPGDYCRGGGWGCIPPTWNELYKMWIDKHFIFIEPEYIPETKNLSKYVFAMPTCTDCEISGTRVQPAFWVDLN